MRCGWASEWQGSFPVGEGSKMGREAVAQANWQGQSGWVTALLEGDALILRGDVRLKLPRTAISAWRVAGPDLVLSTAEGLLTLTLGEEEAVAWDRHLAKPRPGLREKLGLTQTKRAFVLSPVTDELTDELLAEALAGHMAETAGDAHFLLAILRDEAGLVAAIAAAVHHDGHLWAIHEKGRHPALPESTIRTALRAAGFVDSKACAVSDTLSATRYARRKSD